MSEFINARERAIQNLVPADLKRFDLEVAARMVDQVITDLGRSLTYDEHKDIGDVYAKMISVKEE